MELVGNLWEIKICGCMVTLVTSGPIQGMKFCESNGSGPMTVPIRGPEWQLAGRHRGQIFVPAPRPKNDTNSECMERHDQLRYLLQFFCCGYHI